MKRTPTLSLFLGAITPCIALSSGAGAQTRVLIPESRPDTQSGVGRYTLGPLDLRLATGAERAFGCVHLNGLTFVTLWRAGDGQRVCSVLDGNGYEVAGFDQGDPAPGSRIGWADGASDGVNTMLFGHGFRIDCINAVESALTNSRVDATTIVTANGLRTVASTITPVFTGLDIGQIRAIAFRPDGDEGDGSVFVANGISDIVELDLDGIEIGRILTPATWNLKGLAWHPHRSRLWGNASPNAAQDALVEIDPVSGLETGFRVEKRVSDDPGGLDIVAGGLDGRGSGYDLLAVTQGSIDELTGHRLDLSDDVDPSTEVDLLAALDGGSTQDAQLRKDAIRIANTAFHTAWRLDLEDGDAAPRIDDLAAIILNTPSTALVNATISPVASAFFPELSEARYVDTFTAPSGLAVAIPLTEASGTLEIPMDSLPSALIQHRQYLRAQAVYLDTRVPGVLPVMFTNQVRLGLSRDTDVGFPPTQPLGVIVSAEGPNSFNSDTTTGFWRIENVGGHEILAVRLALAEGVFDFDQEGMNDVFLFGNGSQPGCSGTYRNDTHISTDLHFEHTPPGGCDPLSRRGFTIPNVFPPILTSVSIVRFRFEDGSGPNSGFTGGEVLEWDCDTDGVTPPSGDAHAGASVTVWVRDPGTGEVLRSAGTMIVSGQDRSSVEF